MATCLPLEFVKKEMKDPVIKNLIINAKLVENDPYVIVSSADLVNDYVIEQPITKLKENLLKATNACAIAAWRQSKQVYSFDPDFWRILTADKYEQAIPVEIFDRLPFKSFFLQPINCFVYFDRDYVDNEIEMKILQINEDLETVNYTLMKLLPGKTIDESAEIVDQETKKRGKEMDVDDNLVTPVPRENLYPVVQAILYICAQNADIKENEAQKKIYKPTSKVRDQYKEVRSWDVGETIIKSFRSTHSAQSSGTRGQRGENGGGWIMRPHMRRAHWHHFWKGTGDNRELILRWVAPTFVNKDLGEAAAVITQIKE